MGTGLRFLVSQIPLKEEQGEVDGRHVVVVHHQGDLRRDHRRVIAPGACRAAPTLVGSFRWCVVGHTRIVPETAPAVKRRFRFAAAFSIATSMRIVIFPMGSAGDVFPFIGVGKALRQRGHDVHVCTNAYFEDTVKAAGLEFHAVGTAEDFRSVTDDPNLWHPRHAFMTIVRKALEPTYARLLELADDLHKPGDTCLVASSLGFGVRNARDKLGIPTVSVHLAPAVLFSEHRMPRIHGAPMPQSAPRFLRRLQWNIASWITDRQVLPGLNAFRREHSLPPARDVIRSWWHSPDLTLGLWPDWFGPPQLDWPAQLRLTGFPMFDDAAARPMPDELREFLRNGSAPVVFTPGSAMSHGREFFTEAAAAMAELAPRRGLLMSQYPETIPPDLPDNVRHFTYAPYSELLPAAAAIVYHGGVGTCAQALRAGIPHVIGHMAHDQLDNLSRVRDLGVGDGTTPARLDRRWLARRLPELIADSNVITACSDIAGRFDPQGWLRETCELIESATFTG